MPAPTVEPSAGRRILHGTFWNLVGLLTPLIAAYFCIPILIVALGPERFALLTMIWLLVGYFGLFDLGLSRALTHRVADRVGAADPLGMATYAWTGAAVVVAVTIPVALLMRTVTPFLVDRVLHVPPAMAEDARAAFVVVAYSIPLVAITSALRGVLEGLQRFALVNAVRTPLGILSFVVPVVVWPMWPRLEATAWALTAVRAGVAVAFLVACWMTSPALRRPRISSAALKPLFTFGAAMTVSNIVGPLMVYADRFAIGSQLSLAAVTYYATPFEMVTRVLVLPTAVGTVLFPMFSTGESMSGGQSLALFERASRVLALLLIPVSLLTSALAPEILTMWLGAEFAARAAVVLQWLSAGCLFNGMAHMPFALLQGRGGAGISARIHLLELPVYVVLLWVGIRAWGVEGAAIAWALRCAADWVLLSWQATRLVTGRGTLAIGGLVGAGTILNLGAMMVPDFRSRVALTIVGLLGLAAVGMFTELILKDGDRDAMRRLVRGAVTR